MSERRISDVQFENEANLIQGSMMIYEQKPKQDSLIEPGTMAKIESMIEKQIEGYFCTNCGHTSKHIGHLREHVEKHIEGLEYPCNSCNKILRSSHSFREHKRKKMPFSKFRLKSKEHIFRTSAACRMHKRSCQ